MITKLNLSALEKDIGLYFERICQDNRELKLELSATGEHYRSNANRRGYAIVTRERPRIESVVD